MSSAEGALGSRILTYVLCFAHLGYLVYYFGWVWTMTQWQWEYTGWLSVPVPDPASWINQRYTVEYVLYALMIFNLFPPYVMLWITVRPQYAFRYFIHSACVAWPAALDAVFLVWWVLVPWIWQNNSTVWPFSVVNSVSFCCKNYGAVASSYACANVHDCLDLPTTPTIYLHTNPIFEDQLLAVTILLFVFLLLHVVLNVTLRVHGSTASAPSTDQTTLPQPNNSNNNVPNGESQDILHVFNTIYVVLACILLIFGLLVLNVRCTHQYPATGPIGIRCARNTVEAVGLVMSASVIVMPALVLVAMTVWQRRWLLYLVFALVVLLSLVHFFSFMTMIYSRGTANRPGQPNSMANHALRCCAGDVFIDPQSECDNAVTCNLPVAPFTQITGPLSSSQVPYNPVHTLIFWVMFVLLVLDVIIIVMLVNVYIGRGTMQRFMGWQQQQQQPVQRQATIAPVNYPPPASSTSLASTLHHLHPPAKFNVPSLKDE